MRTTIRLYAAVLLAILFLVVGAANASAHAVLVSSDPAENATLPTNPERVNATFNEQMQPAFAAMTVIGPDGGQWSDGEVAVQGAVISVGVRPLGPAGIYTVNYRATSADGHVVSGSWSYTVTESPPAQAESSAAPDPATMTPPAQAAPTATENAMPVWPFAVGAAAIVAAGALWAARRRS